MDSERDSLRYEIVFGGVRSTSRLLYLDCNKCFYIRKCIVNECTERFVCYENRLNGCKSSVIKIGDLVYASNKNFEHSNHYNHEKLHNQFKFKNDLKRKASELTSIVGDQGRLIPLRSLYNKQMEK